MMFASYGSEDEFDQTASFATSANSSDTDSERDLKEVEELLYSQIHYMSNTSYKDINGTESDEILVTLVGNKCVESPELEPGSLQLLGESVHRLLGKTDGPHRINTTENADVKLKSKEPFDATNVVVLDEISVSSSDCILSENLESLTAVGTKQLPQSAKFSKRFTSTPVTSTDKKTVYVNSSSSESSYDAFFFDGDNSSLDSDSGKGDTRINFVGQSSSDAKLKKILTSLPGTVNPLVLLNDL